MSQFIAKPMGQLLLKGWAMLAENCPTCNVPLMRDPQTKDRTCLSCQRIYPAGEDLQDGPSDAPAAAPGDTQAVTPSEGEANVSAGASADAAGAAAVPNADTPWRAQNRESDKAAELLSEKMLQGWALLETTCPRCNTPLVRNKVRRMLCVMCQSWVVAEADAAGAPPGSEAAPTTGRAADPALPGAVAAVASGSSLPPAASLESVYSRAASVTLPMPPVLGTPQFPGTPAVPGPTPALGRPTLSVPPTAGAPAGVAIGSPVSRAAFHNTQRRQQLPTAASAPVGRPAAGVFAPPPQLLSLLAASLEEKLWQAQRMLAATSVSSTDAVRGYTAVVCDCLDAMAKVRLEAHQQQL